MPPKPKPKKEIVVTQSTSTALTVTPATPEATRWLKDNAPDYGTLYKNNVAGETRVVSYTFLVSDLYNLQEVTNWIERMGVE